MGSGRNRSVTDTSVSDFSIHGFLSKVFVNLGDSRTINDVSDLARYLSNFNGDSKLLHKISKGYKNAIRLNDFEHVCIGDVYIGRFYEALVNGKIEDFIKTIQPIIKVSDSDVSDYLKELGETAESLVCAFKDEVRIKERDPRYSRFNTHTFEGFREELLFLNSHLARTQSHVSAVVPLIFGGALIVGTGGLQESLDLMNGYFVGERSDGGIRFCHLRELSCDVPTTKAIHNQCNSKSNFSINTTPMKLLALVSEVNSHVGKIGLANRLKLEKSTLDKQLHSILTDPTLYKSGRDFVQNNTAFMEIVTGDNVCSFALPDPSDAPRLSRPFGEPNRIQTLSGSAIDGVNRTILVRTRVTYIELFVNIKKTLNIDLFEIIDQRNTKKTTIEDKASNTDGGGGITVTNTPTTTATKVDGGQTNTKTVLNTKTGWSLIIGVVMIVLTIITMILWSVLSTRGTVVVPNVVPHRNNDIIYSTRKFTRIV